MIILQDIWKRYHLNDVTHRSLREDIVRLFKGRGKEGMDNSFWALQGVNLTIKKGECVGLYGHNGAGKSTILKLIDNITYPTRGTVRVEGRVAPLIQQGAGFHKDLTGRENIYVNAAILGMNIRETKEKIPDIIEFSGLDPQFIDLPVKKYSSGMFVRLAFSVAVHTKADIFLIDEILAVGDTEFQKKCLNQIVRLKKSGMTMLLVSHNIEHIKLVADKIVYMSKGKIEREELIQ